MAQEMNGAEIMVRSLEDLGVNRIFGYTGATILPAYHALGRSSIAININANEQSSAFSAAGYSRSSDRVGVAVVTSGPAITNTLTAVADSFADSVPLLVFAGQVQQSRLDTDEFQHINVKEVFAKARDEGRLSLGDMEARIVAEAYGLRLPASRLAATAEEAVQVAREIGFPVVLKIASPDILHKTDIGGVKVGLASPADVRDAFELIVYRAQRYQPDAHIWGCQVQAMAPKGLEVLVGMNRDPQFGPLVTFGLGGVLVEVLKDVTFRIAPFTKDEATQMLSEIRAHALLDGVRGGPPADKAVIVDTLLRVSQLVTDFPEIVEMDVNPLVVYEPGQGAIGLDVRMVLK